MAEVQTTFGGLPLDALFYSQDRKHLLKKVSATQAVIATVENPNPMTISSVDPAWQVV